MLSDPQAVVPPLFSQVCQQIRKLYRRCSIPVIMLSAKSSAEAVAKGLEAGANDYIKKPFERAELISRIKVQIRNRYVSTE